MSDFLDFSKQSFRLLRERWSDATSLAQELYSMLSESVAARRDPPAVEPMSAVSEEAQRRAAAARRTGDRETPGQMELSITKAAPAATETPWQTPQPFVPPDMTRPSRDEPSVPGIVVARAGDLVLSAPEPARFKARPQPPGVLPATQPTTPSRRPVAPAFTPEQPPLSRGRQQPAPASSNSWTVQDRFPARRSAPQPEQAESPPIRPGGITYEQSTPYSMGDPLGTARSRGGEAATVNPDFSQTPVRVPEDPTDPAELRASCADSRLGLAAGADRG